MTDETPGPTSEEMGLTPEDLSAEDTKPEPPQKNDGPEKLVNESLQAEWLTYKENELYGVKISYGDEGFIAAELTYSEQKGAYLNIGMFEVNKELQGQGIGSRLLKSLVVEGKEYGATRLGGHVTSESALRTRAKVFGKENLVLLNEITRQPLGISYDEVLVKDRVDCRVEVDLTKVDTSDWEGPQRV